MEFDWKPYVPVAERRRQAEREMAKQRKSGKTVSPVRIEGRAITTTFWGKAWCENLERYSDYANRLPRGRTYVRNGSVVDLQLAPGKITAQVRGSELYRVAVSVAPAAAAHWRAICGDCAGSVDSLVDLLQGRLSKGVMERICRQGGGLFPAPVDLKLSCSCPDWADMCKHVAAVMYGVGHRFDQQPELLFKLRGVEAAELIAAAGQARPLGSGAPAAGKVLDAGDDLAALFGLDMAQEVVPARRPSAKKAAKKAAVQGAARKVPAKKVPAKKAVAKKAAAKTVRKSPAAAKAKAKAAAR